MTNEQIIAARVEAHRERVQRELAEQAAERRAVLARVRATQRAEAIAKKAVALASKPEPRLTEAQLLIEKANHVDRMLRWWK